MKNVVLAAAIFLLPSVVFGANFAKQSLFLSKSSVVDGETVRIYSVVQNDTAGSFVGKLVVRDESKVLGSPVVNLDAGAVQTVSILWTPSAGKHTIKAQLVGSSGEVAGEESETFSINPKPSLSTEKESQVTASVESSEAIQNSIGKYSPQTENIVHPAFVLIDGGRQAAAGVLDKAVDWSKSQIGTKNISEAIKSSTDGDNASDPAGATSGVLGTLWFVLATLALYAASILRWLVGSAGVFYPVFAILLLYVLWRIIKRIRRPAY